MSKQRGGRHAPRDAAAPVRGSRDRPCPRFTRLRDRPHNWKPSGGATGARRGARVVQSGRRGAAGSSNRAAHSLAQSHIVAVLF